MFTSLRFRLILLVLLAILPALGLALYSGQEQRKQAAVNVKAEALRLARLAASHQEALIEGGQQLLVALAQLPAVREGDLVACDAFFAGLLQQYAYYANLGVSAPNGDLLCSALPHNDPVSYADRDWLQGAVKTRDFVIGQFVIGRLAGKAILPLAYPGLDEAGQVQYVVFAAIDLAWLNQLPVEVQLPEGSVLTVIDRLGTILARYPDPDQWVGKTLPEAPIIETILTRGGEGTTEAIEVDGIPRLYAFTPLNSEGEANSLYIYIGIPTEIAYAEVNRMIAVNLAGLGMAALVAMAVAWGFGNVFIMRRVNSLLRATQRLANGDLKTRTEIPYGYSELSLLAQAFDGMAEALEQREAERKQAEERYRHLFETMMNGFALHEILCAEDGKPYDYRFLDVNPAFEKITGLQAEAVVGKTVREVIPGIESYWIETYGEVALSGNTVHFENYNQALDKHFEVFAYSSQKGQFATLFMDITERKRTQDELLRINRALRTISECNQVLVHAENEASLLHEICQTLVTTGGYRMAWVGYAEQDEAKTVRPVAQAGYEEGYLETLDITWANTERGQGPTDTAIRTGNVCKVNDILSDSTFAPWRADAIQRGYSASIALPLVNEGKAFGALNIYAEKTGAFEEQEERLLRELADDLAYGILALRTRAARQQAEYQIQTHTSELTALYDLSRALADANDIDTILKLVTRHAAETVQVTFARFVLLEGDDFVVRAAYPIRVLDYDLRVGYRAPAASRPYCQRAIKQNIPVVLHVDSLEIGDDEREALFLGFARTICLVPLRVGEHALGLLMLGEMRNAEREPFISEKVRLARSIGNQAAIAIDNASLFADLQRSNLDLILAYDTTIEGWSHALDLRDKETEGHTQRVTEMALRLAQAMGVSEAELVHVRRGALLHDIGKMGVPDHILLKPGPLTEEEWVLMRKHPVYAYEMLAPIDYLKPAQDIPYFHHEKWDGSGYPHGLKGEQIPLAARIFAVVDVWDALTSDRPYRKAWTREKAIRHIQEQAGSHFDPEVVKILLMEITNDK